MPKVCSTHTQGFDPYQCMWGGEVPVIVFSHSTVSEDICVGVAYFLKALKLWSAIWWNKYWLLLLLFLSPQHWECKMLYSLFMFAISASQTWMLMEGLYLYLLIHKTMATERLGVRPYILLGWGESHTYLLCYKYIYKSHSVTSLTLIKLLAQVVDLNRKLMLPYVDSFK